MISTPDEDSGSVMVLLAHPRPGSFNHALAERIVERLPEPAQVRFHDLYEEGFDPLLRAAEAHTSGRRARHVASASREPLLAEHRRQLSQATALVAVHPNWWGKPPAILAGWMDRVLVPGVAYRLSDGGGAPIPLLQLRRVLVVNTTDTPAHREEELFGDPLHAIWTRCLPPYLGRPEVERIVLRVVAESDPAQRRRWLEHVGQRARHLLD